MGWSYLPVAVGSEASAAQIGELRAAIIERRRAVNLSATGGLGDPAVVAAGSLCAAAKINDYRVRVEELFGAYLNTNESGNNWTKSTILQAALGKTEWTTVPARAGAPLDSPTLAVGNVMYAEHLNEMKQVIDRLYLVALMEKAGRQYASDNGQGWIWSTEEDGYPSTCHAGGNYQASPVGSERAQSAPFKFTRNPIGAVTVAQVRTRGFLTGTDIMRTVKFINFVNNHPGDPQPSDAAWHAELRISTHRPAGSPRGTDTTVAFANNLADDGTHTQDSKNSAQTPLAVYITDYWGPKVLSGVPPPSEWPFWLTTVIEDYVPVIAAYAAEAASRGRQLQVWYADASFELSRIWARLSFQYQ
jgi:hypothetical protein